MYCLGSSFTCWEFSDLRTLIIVSSVWILRVTLLFEMQQVLFPSILIRRANLFGFIDFYSFLGALFFSYIINVLKICRFGSLIYVIMSLGYIKVAPILIMNTFLLKNEKLNWTKSIKFRSVTEWIALCRNRLVWFGWNFSLKPSQAWWWTPLTHQRDMGSLAFAGPLFSQWV